MALLVKLGLTESLVALDETATTVAPPDEITGNPMGTCRCDDEIWLAEGCSYAFHCDSSQPMGGEYIACPEVRLKTEQ